MLAISHRFLSKWWSGSGHHSFLTQNDAKKNANGIATNLTYVAASRLRHSTLRHKWGQV